MNFLLHLYLSGREPEIMVGNFMGDFVKGTIGDRYPDRVRAGLVLHRRIDSFAQGHPLFQRSRARLDHRFGLYRGVLVDLFFDHFLAADWVEWSDEPFDAWLIRARERVDAHHAVLPERLQGLATIIFEELLPSYREVSGIGHALERMSRRVRRPNPLASGVVELEKNYAGLRDDFRGFVPAAEEFVKGWLSP
jgi:acyl carrier protein phosphodiesterase